MSRKSTATSWLHDPATISRAVFPPELYFSSDSGSSDESFLSYMSSPASTSSSFSDSKVSLSNFDGPTFTLSLAPPEEQNSFCSSVDPKPRSHAPRKLHKRPPLQRLNIKSVPFPTCSPSGSPLLGIWRTNISPGESPLLPSGPSSRAVKFASPVTRHQTSHRHLPRSPHPNHLNEHTDAILSLVLAGDLPVSRTRTLSGTLDAAALQPTLDDETEISNRDPRTSARPSPPLVTSPVLLACQEFVRAERGYLSSLRAAQQTTSLLSLLSLIDLSQHFLSHIKHNPSLECIAEAFLSSEVQLTAAFTSWYEDVATICSSNNENIRSSLRGRSLIGRGESLASTASGTLKPSRSISGLRAEKSQKGLRWKSRSTTDLRRGTFNEQTKRKPSLHQFVHLPAQRAQSYCLFFEDASSIWVTESTSRVVARALSATRALTQKVDHVQRCVASQQTSCSA